MDHEDMKALAFVHDVYCIQHKVGFIIRLTCKFRSNLNFYLNYNVYSIHKDLCIRKVQKKNEF